jgi:outer membrane lipoprotein SlyB
MKVLLIAVLIVVSLIATVIGQKKSKEEETYSGSQDKWEYLIVSGGTINVRPTEIGRMKKEPDLPFREAFVVGQNLDKLGQKGWELISVSGSPADPVFYFKRRK